MENLLPSLFGKLVESRASVTGPINQQTATLSLPHYRPKSFESVPILSAPVELSVIIPVYQEGDNIAPLAREIAAALEGRSYELIFVDDASTDNTRAELTALKATFPHLRAISHPQNAGQSRAIRTGAEVAKGRILATLDGDGQNDPADLPALYRHLLRADAPASLGMVIGTRADRQDSLPKRLGSKFANRLRQRILKDSNDDSACGIKVIARDLFLTLPYFDHMHRFMPALVQAQGRKVETLPVNHRPRQAGASKYSNLGRARSGLKDIRGVMWLAQRNRPTGGTDEL